MGDRIRNGGAHEGQITPADIPQDNEASPKDYIHVGCICVDRWKLEEEGRKSLKEMTLRVGFALLLGIAHRILFLRRGENGPQRVLACEYASTDPPSAIPTRYYRKGPDGEHGRHHAEALFGRYGFRRIREEADSLESPCSLWTCAPPATRDTVRTWRR
jgi:hypothetical protein